MEQTPDDVKINRTVTGDMQAGCLRSRAARLRPEHRNQMNSEQTPIARRSGIVVKKMDNDVLIYDTEHHQAHCLNENAALIWEHCDDKRTVQDLCGLLNADKDTSRHQKEQIIWIALIQLEKVGLLDEPIARPETVKGMTRRQLIKAAGIAALIAIPVVSTMMAPTAAQASTCSASGQSCTSSAECCSGLCDGTNHCA